MNSTIYIVIIVLLTILLIFAGTIILKLIKQNPSSEIEKLKTAWEIEKAEKLRELQIEINEKEKEALAYSLSEVKRNSDMIQNDLELHRLNLIKREDEVRTILSQRKKEVDLEFEKYKELNEHKLRELDNEISAEKELKETSLNEIKTEIEIWRSKQDAAIQVFQSLDELKSGAEFNKISFTSEEGEEIKELDAAIRRLRNPMPFRKAVYDIYYKNKVNDLVARVVGNGRVSGIYKITHIESGKCYVGQSVNIGDRWKQHAKRGCGADVLTNNKLYPAMMELKLENFSFEVVETTEDTSRLNEMEKYWQEYLKAKEFGYSMK